MGRRLTLVLHGGVLAAASVVGILAWRQLMGPVAVVLVALLLLAVTAAIVLVLYVPRVLNSLPKVSRIMKLPTNLSSRPAQSRCISATSMANSASPIERKRWLKPGRWAFCR